MSTSTTSIYFFFFNDTSTTEIYTLSLHDALPISPHIGWGTGRNFGLMVENLTEAVDRKSTRLNSSHVAISYAVFCLKKKKILTIIRLMQLMFVIVFVAAILKTFRLFHFIITILPL